MEKEETKCDGSCEKQVGEVKKVHVHHIESGQDFELFNYCEGAIEDDRNNGFEVTVIDSETPLTTDWPQSMIHRDVAEKMITDLARTIRDDLMKKKTNHIPTGSMWKSISVSRYYVSVEDITSYFKDRFNV